MYYFKKPIVLFLIRLIFEIVAFSILVTLALNLYNYSAQAQSQDAVYGLLVLGIMNSLVAAFTLWQIYRLVADFVQAPIELVGFVVAKERVFKKSPPTSLGQIDWQSDVRAYNLRLLPPEWVQEYYDQAQGTIRPKLRSRGELLFRDRQTMFRVPQPMFDMVLEHDLVRIFYARRQRTVFGLEVMSSITPPSQTVSKPIENPTQLLPDPPPFDATPAQWREIED